MYDARDIEQRRQQIKQRYNRRFFIGAHMAGLVLVIVLQWFGLLPGSISALLAITLVPHLIYVAYMEYRDWLEVRVDRELHGTDDYQGGTKRKRYTSDPAGESVFRLLDDGEIEEVPPQRQLRHAEDRPTSYKKQRKKDDKRHKSSKKRRKFDTDEFDVKKVLKKLKDIVD